MASWPDFRPAALIGALVQADVDFVVIGGVAVVVQASPRFTRDLDITYATNTSNLERLGALLVSLNARLRGIDDEVTFTPDARTLHHTEMLTLPARDGNLDLGRLLVDRQRARRTIPQFSSSVPQRLHSALLGDRHLVDTDAIGAGRLALRIQALPAEV